MGEVPPSLARLKRALDRMFGSAEKKNQAFLPGSPGGPSCGPAHLQLKRIKFNWIAFTIGYWEALVKQKLAGAANQHGDGEQCRVLKMAPLPR